MPKNTLERAEIQDHWCRERLGRGIRAKKEIIIDKFGYVFCADCGQMLIKPEVEIYVKV